MQEYLYYIYTIAPQPTAAGEYVGPFPSAEERDAEAKRLRTAKVAGSARTCVYRANIEKELADQITPSTVAA
ncbi:MAG: hypothetical protein AAF493_22650 [Pseudomonadota bacterium]